jgi:protein arginine kinase activator
MKKCDRCAKPAVYHITEIRDGEAQALHFCEQCAKQHLSHPQSPDGPETSGEGSPAAEADKFDEVDQQVCPNCGISFKEFRSQGRLGCPHDYIAFQEELLPLLENIHGETQHVGKSPKRAPHASQKQYRLIKLRNRLRAAIEDEMYEEAARLRDEIQTAELDLASEELPPRSSSAESSPGK